MGRHNPFYSGIEEKLKQMYLGGMCAQEIKDILELPVSTRSVQRLIKKLGVTRTDSEHRLLAIKKGRMNYESMKVKLKAGNARRPVNSKLRYEILSRDNFRCVLCGLSASDNVILQVDHIIRPVDGGENLPENLRTLCHICNHGRYESIKQKLINKLSEDI